MTEIKTAPFAKVGCVLHRIHIPRPMVSQMHHAFPKYLQARALGITEERLVVDARFDRTTIPVCGTDHDTLHHLIDAALRGDQPAGGRGAMRKWAQYAVNRFNVAKHG